MILEWFLKLNIDVWKLFKNIILKYCFFLCELTIESVFMRYLFKLFILILLFSCNKNEEPQEQVNNNSSGEYTAADTLVGIDEEIQDTLV